MISIQDLNRALDDIEHLFPRLQSLYDRLPETRCACDQPGVCCTFLPEMTTIEALQWLRILQGMPDQALESTLKRFVEFYFTSFAHLSRCPFLLEGACTIYDYRTFACRAYGLWSPELGRKRTSQSREEKKALRSKWKQYGVDLPASVVEHEIDYCGQVTTISDDRSSDSDMLNLFREIYELDREIGTLQERFEQEYHSDFSFLVTSLALGMKKALIDKLAVTKEMVQEGTDVRLQRVLDLVSPEKFRPEL